MERSDPSVPKSYCSPAHVQEAYLNLAMAYKSNGDHDKETEILQDIVELFGTAEKWGAYAESRLAELQAFGGSSTLL